MQDEAPTNLQVAERIARILADSHIPVLVIGAVALAAHRYVRFTEDIDLGVIANLAGMRSLADSLRAEGFQAVFHEPDGQDPLGGVIDVSGPFGLIQIISFEDRFPAAIRDALDGEDIRIHPGSMLRIIPIPQLVALKLYAGGWKSHSDIIELLRRNPAVDLNHLRETCRRYRLRGLDRILEDLQGNE
jgi:hypothetical protein